MKINEVAKLTGVTVRTLHYYDEIGLLHPSEVTVAGYRLYDDRALETLQQILFFRELDFPLQEIKEMMQNPNYSREEAIEKQRELLTAKKYRLEKLISLLEENRKDKRNMSFEAFDRRQIEEAKKNYAAEVKEKWGGTREYEESMRKTEACHDTQWKEIQEENNEIFRSFAQIRHKQPGCEEAMALVRRWQDQISSRFYQCTDETLAGLALMYREDERFWETMDQFGQGTAVFMADAIEAYCAGLK